MRNFFPVELRASREEAKRRGIKGPGDIQSGLLDVYGAMRDTFVYEDLSTSEYMNSADKVKNQFEILKKHVTPDIRADMERTAITARTGYSARRFQSDGLSGNERRKEWMKENAKIISELKSGNPQAGFKTLDEIEKEIAEKGRALREKYESVANRATGFDRVAGTMLGAMRGSFQDPLVLSTLWMGANRAAGILRSAAIGFGVGAGTEVAIQPLVYDYKKKIDSPYSFNEAALNVLAAGVGGAIFEGGIKSLIKGYDLLKAKGKLKTTPDTDAARDVLEQLGEVMDGSPFDNAKPENRDAHVKAFDKAMKDVGEGKPADVQEIVSPVESGQPETVPAGKSFKYREKDLLSAEQLVRDAQSVEAAGSIKKAKASLPQKPIAKEPWEMTIDEMYKYHKRLKEWELNLEKAILGKDYGNWKRAIRGQNSRDDLIVSSANDYIGQIESKLDPKDVNKLYGIGEKGKSAEDIKDFIDAVEHLEETSPKELGKSLRYAVTEIGEGPPKNPKQEIAYTQMVFASRIIEEKGWDSRTVSEAAIKSSAKRFSDPEDAIFMLRRYLKITEAPPGSVAAGKSFRPTSKGDIDYGQVPVEAENTAGIKAAPIRKAKERRDAPRAVNEAELEVGDKFNIYGEKYEKVGETEEGGSVLKDGETIVVEPFDEVSIDRGTEGIQKTDYKNLRKEGLKKGEVKAEARPDPVEGKYYFEMAFEDLEVVGGQPTGLADGVAINRVTGKVEYRSGDLKKVQAWIEKKNAEQSKGIKISDKDIKTADEIGRFFDEAFSGDKNKRKTLKLGKVDADTVEKIKEASQGQINVEGFEHVLSDDALRHVLNKHGEKATRLYKGEPPITKEDISLISEIVRSPDNISISKTEQGLDAIKYEKRFNGEIIYVEEIRTGKKKLALKTMYKRGAAADVPPKRPSRPTSETLRSPDSNIGQEGGKVNTEADEAAYRESVIRKAEEMVAGETADNASDVLFEEDGRSFTMKAREALEETDKEINLFKKIEECMG